MSLPRWKRYVYATIAAEISSFSRYYDRVIQWKRHPGDTGFLLDCIEAPSKENLPGDLDIDLREERQQRTAVLLNGTFNYSLDIQELLAQLRNRSCRTTRIVAVVYNPYYSSIFRAASRAGIVAGLDPTTFTTYPDLRNIARLSGFEMVRARPAVYLPFRLLGLGSLVNRLMPLLPFVHHLGLVSIVTLRPIIQESRRPSISIIVPARNERGNMQPLIDRLPDLGTETELLLVEGHSTDGTWEEIERVAANGLPGGTIRTFRQEGVGKNDAVRLAISQATLDLVTILDADLSMPPELLTRFYDAYCAGMADFINGSRLVYPMEGKAMRFLNRVANVFFAKALSFTLDVRITDSLCGTKLVARHDLYRMQRWRSEFGDFDPFGDFELLFPAAVLGLGMVDVPIRYRARSYGQTNIHRFRHGFLLLKMTALSLFRLKLGRVG